MLTTHLICGGLLGLGAALSSWVLGAPVWAALLVCALVGAAGGLASAIGMYLFPPEQPASARAPEDALYA